MTAANPYSWISREPKNRLERPQQSDLRDRLLECERLVLVGGHGMGKTVLLTALAEAFDAESTKAVLVVEKASAFTVLGCAGQLAGQLGFEDAETLSTVTELLDWWFGASGDGRHLVLLYDEIDHYVDGSSTVARDFFNALASAHGKFSDRMGIVVAGGLGVYRLESEIGSDYTNAATSLSLAPFDRDEIAKLAQPFADDGRPLSAETIDAIQVFSGGNPRILTYFLQQCWALGDDIGAGTIFDIEQRFREEHQPFIRAVHRGLGIEGAGSPTNRIWRHVDERRGPYRRGAIRAEADVSENELKTGLELLRASGLIHVDGAIDAQDLDARGIASFLRPIPDDGTAAPTRDEQFDRDFQRALARIGRWGLDFYRDQDKTELVPESVFSAFLAAQLAEAGWRVDREAMQGPGFTDIKLAHPRYPDEPDGVVEVKLWSNPDRPDVHAQTTGYHAEGSGARQLMAIAVVASLTLGRDTLVERYRERCVPESEFEREDFETEGAITHGTLAMRKTGDGAGIRVRHYVLNLPRRRARPGRE